MGRGNANHVKIGDQYGRWTITGPYVREGKNNDAVFPAVCSCGSTSTLKFRRLQEIKRYYPEASCGCYHLEVLSARRKYFFDPGTKGYNWERTLWTDYGLTTKQYHEMVIKQSGLCGICEDQLSDPHVDHCHTTGVVRGLLCHHCNTLLGLARDNILVLTKAVNYLHGAIVTD